MPLFQIDFQHCRAIKDDILAAVALGTCIVVRPDIPAQYNAKLADVMTGILILILIDLAC